MSNKKYYNRRTQNKHDRILEHGLQVARNKPVIANTKTSTGGVGQFFNDGRKCLIARKEVTPVSMLATMGSMPSKSHRSKPANYKASSQRPEPLYSNGKLTRNAGEVVKLVTGK